MSCKCAPHSGSLHLFAKPKFTIEVFKSSYLDHTTFPFDPESRIMIIMVIVIIVIMIMITMIVIIVATR